MSNMEAFNRCTTVVFDLLYDNFPVPIRLDANDLNEGIDDPKIRLFTQTLIQEPRNTGNTQKQSGS